MRVLIVGAGPGGATAALVLARAGHEIVLVEKQSWPRPKTCGDGISPHAIAEGRELGLHFEGDVHLERALITTPRETAFTGGWPASTPWGTTIERRTFDAAIVDAAVAAGATFLPATQVTSLKTKRTRVAAVVRANGAERTLAGDVAILAEGATGHLAATLGVRRHRSRLVALRGYVDTPHALEQKYGLYYDRKLSPGYAWIFPLGERRANVGVCVDERVLAKSGGNAREVLTQWLRRSAIARELLGDGPKLHDLRGGIIPSGRRRRTRGRVFLIGDAAGVADPFTAEGIYQAIRSGRLAAEAIVAAGGNVRAARRGYERGLVAFDRNERAARGLRATFDLAIEPYARHAAKDARFADHLNTDVFLPKRGFVSFCWRLTRAW